MQPSSPREVQQVNEDNQERKVINHLSFMAIQRMPENLDPAKIIESRIVDRESKEVIENCELARECYFSYITGLNACEDAVFIRLQKAFIVIRPCRIHHRCNSFMGQPAIPLTSNNLHTDIKRSDFWRELRNHMMELDPTSYHDARALLNSFIDRLPKESHRAELRNTILHADFFLPDVLDEFADPVYSVNFCREDQWQDAFNILTRHTPTHVKAFPGMLNQCRRLPSHVTVAYPVYGNESLESLPPVASLFSFHYVKGAEHHIMIWAMAVLEEYRRKGIAAKMIQHLARRHPSASIGVLLGEEDFRVVRFFEHLGFTNFRFFGKEQDEKYYQMDYESKATGPSSEAATSTQDDTAISNISTTFLGGGYEAGEADADSEATGDHGDPQDL